MKNMAPKRQRKLPIGRFRRLKLLAVILLPIIAAHSGLIDPRIVQAVATAVLGLSPDDSPELLKDVKVPVEPIP